MADFNHMTVFEKKSRPLVKAHIDMLQNVITRMAKNSAACKSWAIPLVTAILMLATEKDLVATVTVFIPFGLFYLLDCYYFGLERKFINRQCDFINKLNNGEDITKDIFLFYSNDDKCLISKRLLSIKDQLLCTLDGMLSFSSTIVYGLLALSIHFVGKN